MNHSPARASTRRALTGAAALGLTLTVLTACATTPTTQEPSSTAMKPAESSLTMVDNSGHELAFHVTPGNLPAIVLDAGGGLDSSYWDDLAPKISRSTGSMVIAYDRAGMGDSDEVPGAWSAEAAADDLDAGLVALDADQVILVSHSLAGEVSTYYANEHPDTVAGAVFLDASLPELYTPKLVEMMVASNQESLKEAQAAPSTSETRQFISLAQNYGPDHTVYHSMSWPQAIPVIAVVSEETPFPTPELAELWHAAAAQFVDQADNRTLVTADRSSHDIVADRPELVLDEVANILNIVR